MNSVLAFLVTFLLSCFPQLTLGFRFAPMRASKFTLSSTNLQESSTSVLTITESAMKQLKNTNSNGRILRVGVKSGGCSGLSYTMDFVDDAVQSNDHIEYFGDLKCVIDPKSLLFIYGLELDYSDELIGGGFKFSNPNAKSSCGCGKSFGI